MTGWQLQRCSGQEQKRPWWVRTELVWHSYAGSWGPEELMLSRMGPWGSKSYMESSTGVSRTVVATGLWKRISFNVFLHKAAVGALWLSSAEIFSGLHMWKQAWSDSISYPASSPFQPCHQGLADKLPQAVYYGVYHGWLRMPHAVHCQPSCHSIERHHFAPRYAYEKKKSHSDLHTHTHTELSLE